MRVSNSAALWSVSYHVTKFCHQASARRVLVQDLKVVLADAKLTEPETTVCYLNATSDALMKGTFYSPFSRAVLFSVPDFRENNDKGFS